MRDRVFVIAEAGVNHNGSLARARNLVVAAAKAGADAVKFQTFRAENLVTRDAVKAAYQDAATDPGQSQFDMLRELELGEAAFSELAACCGTSGIEFLSTPFDLHSVALLAGLGMRKWKIPSGEITNLPLLRKIGEQKGEVLLSTGMSEVAEIAQALAALDQSGTPAGQVTVLHCNTEYPTPMSDVNLRAIEQLRRDFVNLKGVGYSDHTLGIEVPVAALALGATVIEKHFTLDRMLPGPDHRASLEPDEFGAMVCAIRNIEVALGDGVKRPTASELKNRQVARKSIVAARRIVAGERFSEKNLAVKRPGTGISPMNWDAVIGRSADRDYQPDERIDA